MRNIKTKDKAESRETNINRKYKNSVFVDLFYEDEKAKENQLSLYNALFNTNYTLEEIDIEKIKVDDIVYMKLKNDVSFNVDNRILVFSEHQSTINGNMPLRDLMYVGRAYEQLIPVRDRYKEKMVKIPKPEFYVFYNGTKEIAPEKILKLSDAYVDNDSNNPLSLELEVRVININSNSGSEILKQCDVLNEYTQFVECVRKFKIEGHEDYMKSAIRYCIENHILEEYLDRKGSEVMGFLCAEYDYEMDMQVKGEEKYEEGKIEGKIEGKQEVLLDLLGDYEVSDEIISTIRAERDILIIEKWIKIAARAQSADEFIAVARIKDIH